MKNFEQFMNKDKLYNILLESRGISDSVILIRDNFKDKILNFINDSKKDDYFKNPIFQKSKRLVLFNDKDFKIKDCFLDIVLYRYKENSCNAEINVQNSKIENGYLINSIIKIEIYFKDFDDDFIFKINSIFLHELVHLYEHYNLLKGEKFRPYYWSIGSIYKQLRNTYKNPNITIILDLLYKSLKHEIASQLHQYYDYKKNNKEYDKIWIIIDVLNNFHISNIDDNFIYEMNDVRKHIYNSIKYYTTNKYYLKDLNKSIWSKDLNKDNIDDFIIELKQIFKTSVKYMEEKIDLINKKLKEIDYSDTKLKESIKNDYEILFF